jgi:putrescine carbamoyltransferase
MPTYQVNRHLFANSPSHSNFMHCLSASRGGEATDDVMDHPRLIIINQSENHLHTENGILVYFVYPRSKRPSEAMKVFHATQINAYLENLKL